MKVSKLVDDYIKAGDTELLSKLVEDLFELGEVSTKEVTESTKDEIFKLANDIQANGVTTETDV